MSDRIRFPDLYPKQKRIFEPLILRTDREITIAEIYKGAKTARWHEME
jgi:hypothetical protein